MKRIQYELDTRPSAGDSLPITEGVLWLRMPLPFALETRKPM